MFVLADVATNTAWGVLGLCGAAAISGWFSVRANRQASEAKATRDDAQSLGSEVAQALALVHELVRVGREKDARIDRLQKALADCQRRSRKR